MSEQTYLCRRCHQPRSADQVVELTGVLTGMRSYLCRPSSNERCWLHDAKTREVERIGTVDDDGDDRDDAA